MNPYDDLLTNHNLYPEKLTNEIGVLQERWTLMSPRNRELLMRHITACVLLCNKELNKKPCEVSEESNILKRKRKEKDSKRSSAKRQKGEDQLPSSSKGESDKSGSSSTPSDFSWYGRGDEDHVDIGLTYTEDYRLSLVRYMYNPSNVISRHCEAFKIKKPDGMWDIFDRLEKKFIYVAFSNDPNHVSMSYINKSLNYPERTACCMINPTTAEIGWVNHSGNLLGKSKVKNFILRRKTIMNALGMLETVIQNRPDLAGEIFTSERFNQGVREWFADWNAESYREIKEEDLYPEMCLPKA